MAVMFLAVDTVDDPVQFDEYRAEVGPLLARSAHDVVAYDPAALALERVDAAKRVVAIRFESEQAFREFYDSAEYQAVIGKRLDATTGFALLVDLPA